MLGILDLPPELLLHVISYIRSAWDLECLLLTCHTFRSTITKADIRRRRRRLLTPTTPALDDHRSFFIRIFSPGNLFYNHRKLYGWCDNCLTIFTRDTRTGTSRVDGVEVCYECSLEIGGGGGEGDQEYFTCDLCAEAFPKEEEVECYGELLCVFCHADLCDDMVCPGRKMDVLLDEEQRKEMMERWGWGWDGTQYFDRRYLSPSEDEGAGERSPETGDESTDEEDYEDYYDEPDDAECEQMV